LARLGTAGGETSTSVDARRALAEPSIAAGHPHHRRSCRRVAIARGEARTVHRASAMNTETTAWLIVGVAGTCSGVIAGLQHRLTAGSVVAITAVLAIAAGAVFRILPRDADHAP
jgi:ABC-type nickel/cobalt efflux system permease component RcnA